jgi:NADH dehydrogenase
MSAFRSLLPRVVVLRVGFAGYQAARGRLSRSDGRAEVVVVNSIDYFMYQPRFGWADR